MSRLARLASLILRPAERKAQQQRTQVSGFHGHPPSKKRIRWQIGQNWGGILHQSARRWPASFSLTRLNDPTVSVDGITSILTPMSTRTWYRVALAAQVVLLLYFELCVLVPLGAWNAQPGMKAFTPGNMVLGGAIAVAQGLLLLGMIRQVRVLLWLGLLGDCIWLLLHGSSLWIPYIHGASPEYARMYQRVFGRTTKLLPNFGNHLAPDAMHIFIDVFLIAVVVTLVLYLKSARIGGRPRTRHAQAS